MFVGMLVSGVIVSRVLDKVWRWVLSMWNRRAIARAFSIGSSDCACLLRVTGAICFDISSDD